MEPFCQQTDEELCALAASGDRLAEEALVLRYNRLVRACTRPCFLIGGDSEDLIQEGMIGLLSAIRGFDPHREASFHTYAETCIRNRLRSAMRTALRDKHSPLNSALSFTAPLFDTDAEFYGRGAAQLLHSESPEDLLIGREERSQQIRLLLDKLSRFEKTVLALYLKGFSYQEIARQVDKPPKSVDNAVQRVRHKAAPFFSSGDFSES